jgi:hypothetical protein
MKAHRDIIRSSSKGLYTRSTALHKDGITAGLQ